VDDGGQDERGRREEEREEQRGARKRVTRSLEKTRADICSLVEREKLFSLLSLFFSCKL
jgi:hypothetical protein